MDSIVRAAAEAVGSRLGGAVDLGGSSRSTVLRCVTGDGGSVVVKAFGEGVEGRRGFVAEVAGLSLGIGGPRVLGVDAGVPLLVTEDFGGAPTLADVLLGSEPGVARDGLVDWARGLGRLAAASVGRRGELARLWARYGAGVASWEDEPWVARNAQALPGVLEGAGIGVPPGLVEEVARAGAVGYPAFTPGDTCPDNALLTPDGLRLIDFEAACFQSVFLTAAYCRMPFSSCWCVFRLPPGTAEAVEGAFRDEVVGVYPELADDAVWEAGMRRAVVVWTVDATVRLLPRTAVDGPLHRTRVPVPTRRQVLRHRWESAGEPAEFPAFTQVMRALSREVAGRWEVEALPGYPAFTRG
ncbi:hypothetical protein PV682_30925 [Streptomyces niveiscabiei]|uniref:hypothetical protein n=1 Tax=Streptomyces niveiscabiei TaxID=164115 RepID=UPI0029A0820C|nr:hypothetical protein [Streptomyces niveiscabiei]MDX3385839.1 hypothetical protein [Streptomyces niveiscabiei]